MITKLASHPLAQPINTTSPSAATLSRFAAGAVLSVLSAGFAALATPPFHLWPLILVAFVPMIVAQHRVLPAWCSALAPGITLGFWFASQLLEGLVEAGVPFVFQLLPFYAGVIAAALSWHTRQFHSETKYRWFFLATPVGWVAIDFVRGHQVAMLAGTWGNPVYALWAQPWLLQPVSIVGSYGLELLLLAINWVIAGLVISALDRRMPPPVHPVRVRRALWTAGAAAAVAGAWVIVSFLMMGKAPATLRVAAIQPGPVSDAEEELRRDIEQTRQAAAAGARLVVWREAGLPFDPRVEHRNEFAALARETGVYLVVGFGSTQPDGRRLNMAVVFSPSGDLVGSYGKDHPGTFAGDYSDVRVGHPVWSTAIGRLAVIICYDLDFTDTARIMARGGAQIVAVPSNDSVRFLAGTHYTHLVFRAIENRISLIKADKMRDAAAIDPWGRVIAKVIDRNGRRSTLIADLPLGSHDSVLVYLGDWMGWLCLGGLAVFVITSSARRFRVRWKRTW
jgi:apolipoprotein N-acyltransferase